MLQVTLPKVSVYTSNNIIVNIFSFYVLTGHVIITLSPAMCIYIVQDLTDAFIHIFVTICSLRSCGLLSDPTVVVP